MLAALALAGCQQHAAKDTSPTSALTGQTEMAAQIAQLRQEIAMLRGDLQKMSGQVSRLSAAGAGQPAAAQAPDTTVYDVKVGDSPVLGAEDAPVTIVGFMDYQCPYCPAEYERIKQIVNQSNGKVRFVLKHHPLYFHKQASPAAAAAELARVNKGPEAFWAMSDMLFANNKKLQVQDLRRYAQMQQLNLEQFDDVMASQERIDILLSPDKAEGVRCNITGTPTILVNGLKLQDRSPEGYKTRIAQVLGREQAAVNNRLP
jgi:protein-disulfide isomerase